MFPSPSKAPRLREPASLRGAPGGGRLRAVGLWGLLAVAVAGALWPVRLPAATSSPIAASRPSLLFAGEDVAALQRVELRLAFDRPGTLSVQRVDLGVDATGARVEETWGTTDASLDAGLYVTPKGFPFDPADERRSFPFTVTVDPSVLDRARWAGLRFTFQPEGDAEPTSVTVPVYALPPVGFDATGGEAALAVAQRVVVTKVALPKIHSRIALTYSANSSGVELNSSSSQGTSGSIRWRSIIGRQSEGSPAGE